MMPQSCSNIPHRLSTSVLIGLPMSVTIPHIGLTGINPDPLGGAVLILPILEVDKGTL
jgi:hypothetical protein